MFKWIQIFIFSCSPLFLWAEEGNLKLLQMEKDLNAKLIALRSTRDVEEINKRNEEFKATLKNAIQFEGAFEYQFDSLKSISKITSPDGAFRIFNWNIEYPDFSQHYECLILYKKSDRKTILFELKDASLQLPYHYDGTGDEENWYGALYYNIVPSKKGSKTYYTLIGYDGNNSRSNMKLLESMYFVGNNIRFGYPLYRNSEGAKKRIFLEYAENAFVSLNYDASKEEIVFDHLRPESPNLEGFYEYYVPDMSYDSYKKQNDGSWKYSGDVTPLNKKVEEDDLWENPTDKNAPMDNGTHQKVPVDEASKGKKQDSKTNKTKKKKARFKKLKNPKKYNRSIKSKIYH